MTDEDRDPELETLRSEWTPAPPSPQLGARALEAFQQEFVHRPWWRKRWVLAGAVVAAGLVMAVVLLRSGRATHYEPVKQPHFMIVSAGEHP